MKNYKQFRDELQHAYPVSKWKIKLPICTQLLNLPNFDINNFLWNIRDIYTRLLSVAKDKEKLLKYCSPKLVDMMTWNYTWMIRFDCILNTQWQIKLLELNADYPDGMLMHDYTYWILLNGKKNTKHLDMYLQFFDKTKTLYILYKQQFFLDSFYLEYECLLDLWYNVFIWTRDELDFYDGQCYYRWIKIEQIRSCMDMSKFTAYQMDVLSNTSVFMLNSYDLRTLANKALLQEIDHAYIPKTQFLTQDIATHVIENKDNYVIKPIDMYEWIGVYLWNATSDEDWKDLIEEYKNTNYIVQEFVDMQKIKVALYEDGGIVDKELYFDLCPHIFVKDGKIIGDGHILMRFSENRILNVAKWGGIGYLKK